MNFPSRRFIILSALITLFITVSFFGIAYRILVKFTCKVSYSVDKKKKIKESRAYLKTEHNAREVRFETDDGIIIAGLLIVRKGARRNLLMCHGYRGAKEYFRSFVDKFPHDNVLLFDFRAHGESEGSVITVGYREKKDVHAAVKFLKNNSTTKGLPICGLGISMGAASLVGAAAEKQEFKAIMLESSFSQLWKHLCEVFTERTGLPRVPFMPIVCFLFEHVAGFSFPTYNPCDCICDIDCPVLIVHAKDDDFISVDHAYEIFEKASNQKRLWLVDSARHGYISRSYKEAYFKRATIFFDSAVGIGFF